MHLRATATAPLFCGPAALPTRPCLARRPGTSSLHPTSLQALWNLAPSAEGRRMPNTSIGSRSDLGFQLIPAAPVVASYDMRSVKQDAREKLRRAEMPGPSPVLSRAVFHARRKVTCFFRSLRRLKAPVALVTEPPFGHGHGLALTSESAVRSAFEAELGASRSL